MRGLALGLIIPFILLVVWEAAVRFNWLDAYVFPAPTTILQKIIELAQEGTLWGHVGITFFRVIHRVSSRNNCRGCIGFHRWLF